MIEQKKQKVLLVDDDGFLLDIYSVKFREAGYDLRLAPTLDDAFAVLTSGFEPDILVFDLTMPGIGGEGFLERVNKDHLADRAVKVVLTNQGDSDVIAKLKRMRVDGYLMKASATPSEILQRVMEIVQGKQGTKA